MDRFSSMQWLVTRIVLVAVLCGLTNAANESPEDLLRGAIASQQSGDFDGAIRQYRDYLKLQPNDVRALSNLGAALVHVGRYEEAIPEYRKAMKLVPDMPAIALNLALAYYKMGQFQPAIEQLVKVHKAMPTSDQTTLLLADCYLRLGRDKDVIALLEPLAKRPADSMAVDYMLGTALIRDKQPDAGQIYVDRILHNGGSAEALLLMGMTKMMVADFAGARADLEKAVQLNPNLPDVYSYYGSALMKTGDTPHAAEAFRKELETNPNDFNAHMYLGVLFKEDQDYAHALPHFERALELRPGDEAVRYQLATVHMANGNLDQARQELESIVKQSPDFTEAHVTLATVYYKMKRKPDGDRERAIVQRLNAAAQAKQPGVKDVQAGASASPP